MDFALTDEERMLHDTAQTFCEKELMPHEDLLERTGELPRELDLDIRRKAREEGMITLRQAGLTKIKQGITTVEEVKRETIL